MKGLTELTANMRRIAAGGKSVAAAGIGAGMGVMKSAAIAESPGAIGNEVGSRREKGDDTTVRGIVGLGVGGAAKVNDPHGHFQTAGTKYILARHFIRRAFESSVGRMFSAMHNASQRRLQKLARNQ